MDTMYTPQKTCPAGAEWTPKTAATYDADIAVF